MPADEECKNCQAAVRLWVRETYGDRLKEVETRAESVAQTLVSQGIKDQLHFEQLNNAAEKHRLWENDFRSQYVSQERFNALADRVAIIGKYVEQERGSSSGVSSARHLVFEIITITIAAVAVIATIWFASR